MPLTNLDRFPEDFEDSTEDISIDVAQGETAALDNTTDILMTDTPATPPPTRKLPCRYTCYAFICGHQWLSPHPCQCCPHNLPKSIYEPDAGGKYECKDPQVVGVVHIPFNGPCVTCSTSEERFQFTEARFDCDDRVLIRGEKDDAFHRAYEVLYGAHLKLQKAKNEYYAANVNLVGWELVDQGSEIYHPHYRIDVKET